MGKGCLPKCDTLMTDDRRLRRLGVQPWGSGEGLILIETMAKKGKESVTGGGVHINKDVRDLNLFSSFLYLILS